jgi:hypothetical protein
VWILFVSFVNLSMALPIWKGMSNNMSNRRMQSRIRRQLRLRHRLQLFERSSWNSIGVDLEFHCRHHQRVGSFTQKCCGKAKSRSSCCVF